MRSDYSICALMLSTAALQTFVDNVVSGISIYPWGKGLETRSEILLTKLREELSLSLDTEWLPQPVASDGAASLLFTNVEGGEYVCGVDEGAAAERVDAIPLHFFDSELLSSKLDHMCSAMTVDYWTYEWCHRRGLSQYHMVPTKNTAERHPEWSLGKHVSSSVVRERGDDGNMSAAIVRLVDQFEGGQWCEEIDGPRSSEVVVQCCDSAPALLRSKDSSARKKEASTTTRHPNKIAFLADISEPEVCRYNLTVCSNLMCHPKVSEKGSPQSISLRSVMKDLMKQCVTRQEDWWTYEICFGKATRQFRVQAVPDETKAITAGDEQAAGGMSSLVDDIVRGVKKAGGVTETVINQINEINSKQGRGASPKQAAKMVMKVVSEFNLGSLSSDVNVEEDDLFSRVIHRQEGMAVDLVGKKMNNSVASVHLDYSNGTACDLKDTTRSSRVELLCGAAFGYKSMEIIDINEDSTCHYLFKVSVPGLCALEEFAPKERQVSIMDCYPLDEEFPSEESNAGDVTHDSRDRPVEYRDVENEVASHRNEISGTSDNGLGEPVSEVAMKADGTAVELDASGVDESQKMRRMARSTNRNHVKFEKKKSDTKQEEIVE